MQPDSRALDVGSGAEGCAIHLADTAGCSVFGIDLNPAGIDVANKAAADRGLAGRTTFQHCDAARALAAALPNAL